MSNKVVATVGMAGSGKTELARLFVEKGFRKVRFGDLTEEELKNRNLPQNPQTEQLTREELRRKYGMSAYAILNIPKIDELLKNGNVIVDGLYSWEEYVTLQKHYGDKLFIIVIYASPRTRYNRLSERSMRPLTRQEAEARDYAEIENINKGGPIAMADYTIINEGSVSDLEKEFIKLLEKLQYEKT